MTPEQRLAQAVIERAMLDAKFQPERIRCSKQWDTDYKQQMQVDARDSAREFLAGGPDLQFWCGIARLPYDQVKRSIARRVSL